MSRQNHVATWLQRRGWQQTLGGTWSKPGSPLLSAEDAVRHQTHLDRSAAQAAQARGIAAAVRGVDPEYREMAMAAVHRVALVERYLTTDHVLDGCPELEKARQRNFLGDVMKKAAAEGWIRNTGSNAESHRKASRGRPKTCWESLICGQASPAMELEAVVSG